MFPHAHAHGNDTGMRLVVEMTSIRPVSPTRAPPASLGTISGAHIAWRWCIIPTITLALVRLIEVDAFWHDDLVFIPDVWTAINQLSPGPLALITCTANTGNYQRNYFNESTNSCAVCRSWWNLRKGHGSFTIFARKAGSDDHCVRNSLTCAHVRFSNSTHLTVFERVAMSDFSIDHLLFLYDPMKETQGSYIFEIPRSTKDSNLLLGICSQPKL